MDKRVAFFAGLFALISASASAMDSDLPPGDYPPYPGSPGYERAQAAKKAAQEKWAKMTPEEKAAAKKAFAERRKRDDQELEDAAKEAAAKREAELKQAERKKAEQP